MKTKIIMMAACVAAFAVPPLIANAVDWQFTGATNRTCVATRSVTINGAFDSRIPSVIRINGCNMRSDKSGLMIIFR